MHTLEFDQTLNQLATLSGKTSDKLLREITVSSIKKRVCKLAIPSLLANLNVPLQTDWEQFFSDFSRPVVDVSPCSRDEIYVEHLR